jgi:hypothetical protein
MRYSSLAAPGGGRWDGEGYGWKTPWRSRWAWNSTIASHAACCASVALGAHEKTAVINCLERSISRSVRYCSDVAVGTRPAMAIVDAGSRRDQEVAGLPAARRSSTGGVGACAAAGFTTPPCQCTGRARKAVISECELSTAFSFSFSSGLSLGPSSSSAE